MKSDIEIAQAANMLHIKDVAAKLNILRKNLSIMENIRQSFLLILLMRKK